MIKNLLIVGFVVLSWKLTAGTAIHGTDNNTNICSPVINVKQVKCKRKVIYRNKVKYKTKVIYKTKFIYKEPKRNRFKLFIGSGDGDIIIHKNKKTVSFKKQVYLGIGIQRDLSSKSSIEVNYLFNNNIMLGFGFGF